MGETSLSSSIETLSLSTASPIVTLQYIQRNAHFPSSGLLVGSNDKSGFYEHVLNSDYRYHALPIDSKSSIFGFFFRSNLTLHFLCFLESLSSLHYDSMSNRLLASYRPSSSPARHELYELLIRPVDGAEQASIVSLQLIQTFMGSSANIVLSRSKIVHKNSETYIIASDNGSHGVSRSFVRCLPGMRVHI